MRNNSRKLFRRDELYNICSAAVRSMSTTEITGYPMSWLEFVDGELEEIYDRLNDAGKKKFDKEIERTAKKLKEDFAEFPKTVKNDEEYEEFITIQNELIDKIEIELSQFLLKE